MSTGIGRSSFLFRFVRNAAPAALALQFAFPGQAWAVVPQFNDPGFEQTGPGQRCSAAWVVTSGAGCASNNPHSGTYAAFLDQGEGYSISETFTAPVSGSFDFSAWIAAATGGTGGTYSVQVGNGGPQTITIPPDISTSGYIKYTVPRLLVNANDPITVTFKSSSGRQWINIDDLEIVPSAPNDPQISSDNSTLVAMFNWAKVKANSWVRPAGITGVVNMDENHRSGSGTSTYEPTYWAGYPFRSYFYSRDFAHQFVGAHLLGLDVENLTMLKAFAGTATSARKYYPVWAINFDGSIGTTDYSSDSSFVRELPAPFELTQRVNDGYAWTGDAAYYKDSTLYTFVTNTVDPFVSGHDSVIADGRANGRQVNIGQENSNNIFVGVATYNESAGGNPVEAADSLSSQYQAYLAVATLASANGDPTTALTYATKAWDLQTYYNNKWSVDPGDPTKVIRSYDQSSSGSSAWGSEMSWFAPLKYIMNAGARRDNYMAWLNTTANASKPSNLEAETYLPDAFFAVHDGNTAWAWMQDIYGAIGKVHSGGFVNGDYPEVSFTLLGHVVQGMLGVQPNAAHNQITTVSQLPAGIGWLQVASIPVGNGSITLRHDGQTASTLTNNNEVNGVSYRWHARFSGLYRHIAINGTKGRGQFEQPEGGAGPTYTSVDVLVAPGHTTVVQVSP